MQKHWLSMLPVMFACLRLITAIIATETPIGLQNLNNKKNETKMNIDSCSQMLVSWKSAIVLAMLAILKRKVLLKNTSI